MDILNNLFDDFSEFFGNFNLEKEITKLLKDKKVKTTEFKKNGFITIKKEYQDENMSYYSTTTFMDLTKIEEPEEKILTKEEIICNLENSLEKALEKEDYIKAAKLRDEIKKLKT